MANMDGRCRIQGRGHLRASARALGASFARYGADVEIMDVCTEYNGTGRGHPYLYVRCQCLAECRAPDLDASRQTRKQTRLHPWVEKAGISYVCSIG